MKNVIRKFLLVALTVPLLLSSCKDEDEQIDLGAQVSGTYDYKIELYVENGSQLEYMGTDYDQIGTAVVSKTSTGIEMKEGGEVQLRASKLTAASNGVTFDIESQVVNVDGQDIIVEGYDGVDLSGVRYNGLYETASRELTGYMQFQGIYTDANGDSYEATFVMEITATKI
jgi:hypothetical protein